MEKHHNNQQEEERTDTGAQLRQARIAAGIELDAVASALCIPPGYVTAIEHNDLSELPSPVFVRGYVNGYARFLGVDLKGEIRMGETAGDSAAARFGPLGEIKRQLRPNDPWMRWASISIAVVVLVASLLWWQSQGRIPDADATLPQVAVVTVDTGAGRIVVDPDAQVSALGPVTARQEQPLPVPSDIEFNSGNVPVAGEQPLVEPAVAALPPGQVSLLAVFSDASWIEVRDAANTVLFTGVKQAGETLSLSSNAMIDVIIGNAAAVKLSYNSAPVDIVPFTDDRNVAKIKLGL